MVVKGNHRGKNKNKKNRILGSLILTSLLKDLVYIYIYGFGGLTHLHPAMFQLTLHPPSWQTIGGFPKKPTLLWAFMMVGGVVCVR